MFETTPVLRDNGMPSKMVSSNGRMKIDFKGWDEPNNGRMLWKVDVFFDNLLINDIVFKNGWDYLNEKIDQLDIEDNLNVHYYVPSEGNGRLITNNMEVIDLPYKRISTSKFIGNQFAFNCLLIIYSDQITITALSNYESYSYDKEFDGHIFKAELISGNMVSIKYYNVVDKKRIEKEVSITLNQLKKVHNNR
jgi:hypothetical protein